ncbi:uncharacterized protein LOC134225189 isoform X2 [Armigeres subalbatus]|uniref:uncharacterized protein LOC134225189 isoform X2 n=1 Tax=Armigeres subalbatus TaxID=124917 RepID=UPI002ED39F9E
MTTDESVLPKFVCQHCYGKLVEIDWFRKTCITSYDRLTNMYNNPYGSTGSHEQHIRPSFDMFPSEQRYPQNAMQNIGRLGHAMDYHHSQSNANMPAQCLSNSVLSSENVDFTQTPQKPSKAHSSNRPEKSQSVSSSDLTGIHKRLDQLGAKMDGHGAILQRIEMFMASFSYAKPLETQSPPVSREDLRQRSNESFEEFEQMGQIVTREQLTEFNAKLANSAYEAKYFRYIQSVYKLTGKREGFPFFKTIIRRLIAPTVLICYSWKGHSRTKKGDQTAVVVTDHNFSFRNMFPNIVRFIYRVVNAADFEYTGEDNEKAFSDYLRQKKTEIKRFLQSNGAQRAASSRKRRKKVQPTAVDDGSSVGAEQESFQDPEIYGVNDTTDGDVSFDEETFSDNGADGVDIKQEAHGSSEVDCWMDNKKSE